MATNYICKISVFLPKNFLCRTAIPKWIGISNASGQLRSALNMATLYANSVMFGAITPEKRLLIFVLL